MTKPDRTYLQTKKRKFLRSEPGVKNARLINIDIDHVIPDELHLLLRITDKLIENLINAAVQYDHNMNNTPSSKVLEGPMLSSLVREINSCGVTFNVYCKTGDKRDYSSLTGAERKKLLKFLPLKIRNCQPPEYCKQVETLWKVQL